MINIEQFDHAGIRVSDPDRALDFYGKLGFKLHKDVDFDEVLIIKNDKDVELNLIVNTNDENGGRNILMDMDGKKYSGITHIALRVDDIAGTINNLKEQGIAISQGPVTFGDGHVSVFFRDPDRNVIELRGRMVDENAIDGLEFYDPNA